MEWKRLPDLGERGTGDDEVAGEHALAAHAEHDILALEAAG